MIVESAEILQFVQQEPELLSSNDVLWTFANFAGEDHTNFQTLVAFLNMLSTLVCNYALLGLPSPSFFSTRVYFPIIVVLHAFQACNEEGASRVFELLQGKAFRSVGWTTLFDCLSIYDDKFRQSLQTVGALLPEFQEGDAKALVAYLNVLQKVIVSNTIWVLNFYAFSLPHFSEIVFKLDSSIHDFSFCGVLFAFYLLD